MDLATGVVVGLLVAMVIGLLASIALLIFV